MSQTMDADIQRSLDTTLDAIDFQSMIRDVKDFLEFSEQNISWQHRRELQSIALRPDLMDQPEYRDHLDQGADHRFQVSLPLRVRYSALIAFITSVEWSVAYLNQSACDPVPSRKGATNYTVKVLREFAERVQLDILPTIEDYEALVKLRNCVVHNGGIIANYKFKEDLPSAVARIPGVTLERWHFFGPQVCIARGALDAPIERTAAFVLDLHRRMREQGLQK